MKIREASEADLAQLLGWFSTKAEVIQWGGSLMPFPLHLEQLKVAICWPEADSYALINEADQLLGFAQLFNKFGYRHLSRIAIAPTMRGQGLGYKLIDTLIHTTMIDGIGFSLFVYEDNIVAKKLYKNLGFIVQQYPAEKAEIEGTIFMVKPSTKSLA